MKITLQGEDGTVHITGDLPNEQLSDVSILVRNGHYYVMRFINADDGVVFQETLVPWNITTIL